jgi:hypothetical protein
MVIKISTSNSKQVGILKNAQNQYGRVIYPPIGIFPWNMKKYTFGGQKGKNRPPEPKNGIGGLKSVWSCDRSIEREFYME